MNSFANATNLYNHSEPIIGVPPEGTCTLLTGIEHQNLTLGAFEPCCSNATAIYYERSRCHCGPHDCGDACFYANAKKFKLIAVVCNTSAGRRKKVPTMIAALLVIGVLAFQASASVVSGSLLGRNIDGYQGPGTLIKDLNDSHHVNSLAPRSNPLYTREVDWAKAQQLLGEHGVVDCPSNTLTAWDEANSASTLLVDSMGGAPITIPPGTCRHQEVGATLAQICNQQSTEIEVTPEQTEVAFDLLEEHCTSRKSSGHIFNTASGAQFKLYAKVGVGSTNTRKRASGKPTKRCVNPDDTDVTGCEDIVCNPKMKMNEKGDCPWADAPDIEDDNCASYCEVKAAKYYGLPIPYENTGYCAAAGCTIEKGTSLTIEKSVSLSFGLEGGGAMEPILSAGVSFGVAVSTSTSVTEGSNFDSGSPDGKPQCGWWYKVPVMVHTCGSVSEYVPSSLPPSSFGSISHPTCSKGSSLKKTTGNVCAEIQATSFTSDYKNPDVFVVPRWYDCSTRKPLPDEENSPGWKGRYTNNNNAVHSCM